MQAALPDHNKKGNRNKMKQLILTMISCGALALFVTGCTSFETNRAGNQITVHMDKTVDPEIEVGNTQVEGQATANCLFGVITWGVDHQALGVDYGGNANRLSFLSGPADIVKNGAAYAACNKVNADLLLAPRYNLTVKDYFVFKIFNCEVKGYPGTLKSLKVVNNK